MIKKLPFIISIILAPHAYGDVKLPNFQPNVTGIPYEDSCGVGLKGLDFVRKLEQTGATTVLKATELRPQSFCRSFAAPRKDTTTYEDSGAIYIHWKPRNASISDQDSVIMVKAPYPDRGDQYGDQAMFSGDYSTLAVSAPKEDSCIFTTEFRQINSPNACTTVRNGSNYLADNKLQNSGIVYAYHNPGANYEHLNSKQVLAEASHDAPGAPPRRQLPVSQRLISADPFAIKAFNGDMFDEFGSTVVVSLDGNTIAVGAPGEDNCGTGIGGLGPNPGSKLGGRTECGVGTASPGPLNNSSENSGAVYIYEKNPLPGTLDFTWALKAYIKAPNTGTEDVFGSSLWFSNDGKTLVVGAPGEDNCGTGINGTGQPGPGTIRPHETDCGSVINPGMTNNDALNSGAVYVYKKVGSNWKFVEYVKSSNSNAGDKFGSSISFGFAGAAANDAIFAIGAPGEDGCGGGLNGLTPNTSLRVGGHRFCEGTGSGNNQLVNSGAVYFFQSFSSGLLEQQIMKAPVPGPNDRFGSSLFFTTFPDNQHTFIIGSPGDDNSADPKLHDQINNLALNAGSVIVYNTASHSLVEVGRFNSTNLPGSRPVNNALGSSLGASATYDGGGIFFVGAPGFDEGTKTDSGRVLAIADVPGEGLGAVGHLRTQLGGPGTFIGDTVSEFDYFGGEIAAGAQESGNTKANCDVLDAFTSIASLVGVAKFLTCLGANLGPN